VSEPIANWVIKQVQEHGLDRFAFAGIIILGASFGMGYFVGWRLTIKKAEIDIDKAKAEAAKAWGENFETLARLREKSNRELENVNIAMISMRNAITEEQPADRLRSCRDEMCNVYNTNYLSAFTDYTEMIPRLVDRKECFHRVKTELIPGLLTMCAFLKMANNAKMLEKTGGSILHIRREARDGFLDRVCDLIPLRSIRVRAQIRRIRKQTDPYLRRAT
jgi:hypothetical protein